MKNSIKILLLFLVSYSAPAQNIILKGFITSVNGSELGQVEISLDGAKGNCVSDDKGSFIMPLSKNVKKGDIVRLRAFKRGYHVWDQSIAAIPDQPIMIKLQKKKKSTPKKKTKINYLTIGLKNQEFIFTTEQWKFTVNNKGEDVKSEYTPYSRRREIVPLNSFESKYPTIANNELTINFQFKHNLEKSIYVDNIYLVVEDQFDIEYNSTVFNSWMSLLKPHKFEVTLSTNKKLFDFNLDNNLIEVHPNKAEFFNVKVNGDSSTLDKILKFRIFLSYLDQNGDRHEMSSDRFYHIAFIDKNIESKKSIIEDVKLLKESESEKEKKIIVVPADSSSYDSGEVIKDVKAEKLCKKAIENINNNLKNIDDYVGDLLFIGPSFNDELVKNENMDSIGFKTSLVSPDGSVLYARCMLKNGIKKLFSLQYMKYIFSKLSFCNIRPATKKERDLFYSFISWEIKGKPVMIADCDDLRVLIYSENGKIAWIDILNYKTEDYLIDFINYSTNYIKREDSINLKKIRNQYLDKDILGRIKVEKEIYELEFEDFCNDLLEMSETNAFVGINLLIRDNPYNTILFFEKTLQLEKEKIIYSGSMTWELLCKISILYQNYHHDKKLITKLTTFKAYETGGKYVLKKNRYEHEGKHGSEDGKTQLGTFKISKKTFRFITLSKRLNTNLKLLKEGKYVKALNNYKANIPRTIRSLGLKTIIQTNKRDSVSFRSGGDFELHIFLYTILLYLNDENQKADAHLAFSLSKGLFYSRLLYINSKNIKNNSSIFLNSFKELPIDSLENFLFDDYIYKLTNKRYGKLNDDIYTFSKLLYDKEYEKAFSLSSSLLEDLDEKDHELIDTDIFYNGLILFRLAHLKIKTEFNLMNIEIKKLKQSEIPNEKILKMFLDSNEDLRPHNFLSINDTNLFNYLYGFKNGYWSLDYMKK